MDSLPRNVLLQVVMHLGDADRLVFSMTSRSNKDLVFQDASEAWQEIDCSRLCRSVSDWVLSRKMPADSTRSRFRRLLAAVYLELGAVQLPPGFQLLCILRNLTSLRSITFSRRSDALTRDVVDILYDRFSQSLEALQLPLGLVSQEVAEVAVGGLHRLQNLQKIEVDDVSKHCVLLGMAAGPPFLSNLVAALPGLRHLDLGGRSTPNGSSNQSAHESLQLLITGCTRLEVLRLPYGVDLSNGALLLMCACLPNLRILHGARLGMYVGHVWPDYLRQHPVWDLLQLDFPSPQIELDPAQRFRFDHYLSGLTPKCWDAFVRHFVKKSTGSLTFYIDNVNAENLGIYVDYSFSRQ